MWTGIVVTCPHEHWCSPIKKLLGDLATDVLLVVPDPSGGGGAGVGSGGATLNALLVVAEHLSARRGHTTIVSDLLYDSKLLILHLGPSLLPLPAGLLPVPDGDAAGLPTTNIKRIYDLTSELMKKGDCGVVVAGTDILLKGSVKIGDKLDLSGDVVLFTVPSDVQYATKHGVTVSVADGQQATVRNILYQPQAESLVDVSVGGKVNILSGLVWFSPRVAETLVGLHCSAPLDACTYMGADSGETTPLQISLYYDILTASCPAVTVQQFVEGKCGKTLSRGRSSVSPAMTAARKLVWTEMRRYSVTEIVLEGLNHKYLPPSHALDTSELLSQWRTMAPFMHKGTSVIGHTDNGLSISSDNHSSSGYNLMYGRTQADQDHEDKIAALCVDPVCLIYNVDGVRVKVVFSLSDRIHEECSRPQATWLRQPWKDALSKLDLVEAEVWQGVPEKRRCLFTAKLFKVGEQLQSLDYISANHNIEETLQTTRQMMRDVVCGSLQDNRCLPPGCKFSQVMSTAVAEGWSAQLLLALDNLAFQFAELTGSERTGKLAFILAMTADLLGAMARGEGGLRSGPANNKEFSQGFKLLDREMFTQGLQALAQARQQWLDRPVRLVRAARHYEGAVQLLVRKTVISAQSQVKVDFSSSKNKPEVGQEVVVSCPARLDLSGGWTDTPPICYELGGRVVDVALSLDGVKPIGCKATRIPEMVVQIVLGEGEVIQIRSMVDLESHCNPTAKGALLKCCLLAAKILDLSSDETVEQQLQAVFQAGLRLESWSQLPQGSGMGTSSILAAAVIAATWTAAGCKYTKRDVVHAVLVVEQLLTTGGGWQDQVGGLYPGVNVGTSPPNTQVTVDIEHLEVSDKFLDSLEDRLLVLYTGKPRLAKNLLQNVVRNWYSRDPLIYQTFKDNYSLASRCAERVKDEDLEGLGACLSEYYVIKKILAPGSEPDLVKRILQALSPFSRGGSLAGAGGGGFLAVILKDGVCREAAMCVVREVAGSDQVRFYNPTVDRTGMVVN